MILILEILFLISGVWAVFTGKLPAFLFGGDKYQIEGIAIRVLGVVLLLPMPLAFIGGVVLVLLFDQTTATTYGTLLEIVLVLGVAILALVVVRFVRKPKMRVDSLGNLVPAVSDIEAQIAKKAQGALMYAIFSMFGVASIIVCPLAFIYATQALRLIDQHQVGEQYRGRANTARLLAGLSALFWLVVVGCLVLVVVLSSANFS